MTLSNFKLHMKTSQNVFHLGTSYIILKGFRKNREEKQELFGLRKGETETQRMNERDKEGKEKGGYQLKNAPIVA